MKYLLLLLLPFTCIAQNQLEYPYAKTDATQDVYFGTTVPDPYRWLEYDSLPETQTWIKEEQELSTNYLKKIKKFGLDRELKINTHKYFGTYARHGKYYFDFAKFGIDEPALYIKTSLTEDWHFKVEDIKVVAPEDYKNSAHDNIGIGTYEVSDDNKRIAFCISRNGIDWNEIHVKELFPVRKLDDIVTGVKFSNIEWVKDGFLYVRYPQNIDDLKSENKNAAIYYHKLGTQQSDDRLIFHDPQHPYAFIGFEKLHTKDYLVIHEYYRDKKNKEQYFFTINLNEGSFPILYRVDTLIHSTKDCSFDIIGTLNGKFLVSTTLDAPYGKLLFFEKDKENEAYDFIPEIKQVLYSTSIVGNKIVCSYLKDLDYKCVVLDSTGAVVHSVVFPTGTSIGGFENSTDATTLCYFHSFIHPLIVYKYNVNTNEFKITEATEVLYNFRDLKMKKVFYYSKDSIKMPMILAYKEGMEQNGKNPVLLYGYGGWGEVETPFFSRNFLNFIQNGGIIALPGIRGGGEYGDDWHKQGSGAKKQNTYNDFIAAAEYLFQQRYTMPEQLTIMGGGLMIAAVLNQRPDICKVAIANRGVYDMLRYQKYTIGNAWIEEYGSSDDSLQFNTLYKYSPLHNITSKNYPALLILTADHDDRVVPIHAYKYAAAMQKNNRSDNPVLLYIDKNCGHGCGTFNADVYTYSFIYDELGITPQVTLDN